MPMELREGVWKMTRLLPMLLVCALVVTACSSGNDNHDDSNKYSEMAVATDTYANLQLRERINGEWTDLRPWSGNWIHVDQDASDILVAATGHVPTVLPVDGRRGKLLDPLEPSARLSVVVLGTNGMIVRGETVSITLSNDKAIAKRRGLHDLWLASHKSTTNEKGVVEFELLPNEEYRVGLPDDSVLKLGITQRTKKVLVAGGATRVLSFSPRDPNALCGWVCLENGTLCANAKVTLKSVQQNKGVDIVQELLIERTKSNGAFVFDRRSIPKPPLRVASNGKNDVRYLLSIEYRDSDDQWKRGRFPLDDWFDHRRDLRCEMPPNTTVKILVERRESPEQDASVTLWVNDDLKFQTKTDSRGWATFEGIEVGAALECLAETEEEERKKANLGRLSDNGNTFTVVVPVSVAEGIERYGYGYVKYVFTNKSLDLSKMKTFVYHVTYETGNPDNRFSSGGDTWDPKKPTPVPSIGECMVYAKNVTNKQITAPQRVRISRGETIEVKGKLVQWAEISVSTDISSKEALVFAGISTHDDLSIAGDYELTGGISRKLDRYELILPPNGEYKLVIYAEPRGVPKSYKTRKWREIKLKPFKPGERREIKIEKFWDD